MNMCRNNDYKDEVYIMGLGAPGGAHQLAQAAVVTPHCDCIIWRTPFNWNINAIFIAKTHAPNDWGILFIVNEWREKEKEGERREEEWEGSVENQQRNLRRNCKSPIRHKWNFYNRNETLTEVVAGCACAAASLPLPLLLSPSLAVAAPNFSSFLLLLF